MTHSRSRKQRGFTMVESLVALVVLSVGLLGIASLYVTSLRTGRVALNRTQAVTLVGDMADRIRANGRAGKDYDTDTYGGAPAIQTCDVDNCTAAALAQDDLARWIAVVNGELPGVTAATVTFDDTAGAGRNRYEINIAWSEAGEDFSYRSNFVLIPVIP